MNQISCKGGAVICVYSQDEQVTWTPGDPLIVEPDEDNGFPGILIAVEDEDEKLGEVLASKDTGTIVDYLTRSTKDQWPQPHLHKRRADYEREHVSFNRVPKIQNTVMAQSMEVSRIEGHDGVCVSALLPDVDTAVTAEFKSKKALDRFITSLISMSNERWPTP